MPGIRGPRSTKAQVRDRHAAIRRSPAQISKHQAEITKAPAVATTSGQPQVQAASSGRGPPHEKFTFRLESPGPSQPR